MVNLEKMLLEAAGRKTGRNQHSPQPPRRRPKGSYSDDGTDSRDDDSDDDRGGYTSRKPPSVFQAPLKKRLDPAERDDEHSSSREDDEDDDDDDRYDRDRQGEAESDDDSVGSDLYKGEEDRKQLAKMSELDREMILADRATKRNDKDLKNTIKKQKEKSNQTRKDSPPPHTANRAVRSSARSADRATAKDGALNTLRERARKKLRQQDSESHWKRDSTVKKRGFTTTTALSASSRSDAGSQTEDEESPGEGDSDSEKLSKESSTLTYEDVKGITIRRSKLAKWFMEPFFEELIIGCFVRVGIGKSKTGPIYRLCIVRNVDAADPDRQYKLENKMTHKYLNVVWGNENSAARWQMAMISDSPPIKEEFDQLIREVDRHGGRMPSKQEVMEKREAIEKTNSFVYSAETVKQMLQEKKSTIRRPLNVAAEKDRLRRDLEVAQMKHDEVEVEKIKVKLQELEASRQPQQKDKKAIRLAEMNRKNRVENFKNASEVKPVNTGLKAGEAGYDPFSRRWTRSRNYYVSKPGEAAAEAQAAAVVGPDGGKAATVAALEAAADAGKLVDTSAPVDQGTESNMLHDFDLPISLASLQKFGGPHGVQAGFMARKQRIEATVGCQVPENDGRRHALTLSVSDYKRRRGLL